MFFSILLTKSQISISNNYLWKAILPINLFGLHHIIMPPVVVFKA